MCNCEYATKQHSGAFYCSRFRQYGWTGPLNICVIAELEEEWKDRLSQVPSQVVERQRDYFNRREG